MKEDNGTWYMSVRTHSGAVMPFSARACDEFAAHGSDVGRGPTGQGDDVGCYGWVFLMRIEGQRHISELARRESTMPMSGPTTRRSHPISGDGLQAGAIDASEGENLMLVTPIASMRRSPRLPGDDLEADAIDAPEGEKTVPVPMITSMASRCGSTSPHAHKGDRRCLGSTPR
jgi:hypothetical protein